jgi:predicted glutamine amidotransferase
MPARGDEPMCRWVAYRGEPIYMEDVVTKPCHSLIHQSMQATEAKTVTNGDGFGVGWYGERSTPGVYRELRPAWSDENLKAICAQVRSRLFFAHVRAATGTATSRANCHPFIDGEAMFMHNGQVGCYGQLRRRIENLIPDAAYANRAGTTDSEAIFLIARARAGDGDLVAAFESTLADIKGMMDAECVCEALRFTAVVTDGEDIHAFRWACDGKAPTLYWREEAGNLFIVSEPLDDVRNHWTLVPQGHVLSASAAGRVEVRPFLRQLAMAA